MTYEVEVEILVVRDDYVRNEHVEMYRVEMCRDCVLITANGETSDGFDYDAWSADVQLIWPVAQGWRLGNGWSADDEESWFSWHACETCGSTLGGDREYGHVARSREFYEK